MVAEDHLKVGHAVVELSFRPRNIPNIDVVLYRGVARISPDVWQDIFYLFVNVCVLAVASKLLNTQKRLGSSTNVQDTQRRISRKLVGC